MRGTKRGNACTICQGVDGISKPRKKLLESAAAARREAVTILYLSSSSWHMGRHTGKCVTEHKPASEEDSWKPVSMWRRVGRSGHSTEALSRAL